MGIDVNRERAIDLAVSQIEKQFGKGAIMKLGADALIRDIATISSSRETAARTCSRSAKSNGWRPRASTSTSTPERKRAPCARP